MTGMGYEGCLASVARTRFSQAEKKLVWVVGWGLREGGGTKCDQAEGEEERRETAFLVHGIFLAMRSRYGRLRLARYRANDFQF